METNGLLTAARAAGEKDVIEILSILVSSHHK
jgi:hypothetical protein